MRAVEWCEILVIVGTTDFNSVIEREREKLLAGTAVVNQLQPG